jgi:hypothetical protein
LGQVTFICPDGFQERVPSLMADADIACTEDAWWSGQEGWPEEKPCFGFRMNQGFGTVVLYGYYVEEVSKYRIVLGCGDRPLYWLSDMRLLREIKVILQAGGAGLGDSTRPERQG